MNALGKTADMLVFVLVCGLVPLILIGSFRERVIYSLIRVKTAEFVEEVSDDGKLTREGLESYDRQLDALGVTWQLDSISVNRRMEEPEYAQNRENTETDYVYEPVFTEQPVVLDSGETPVYDSLEEAIKYNEKLGGRKHSCTVCEEGGLCEKARGMRALKTDVTLIKGSPLMKCGIISYSDGTERAVICETDADSNELCTDKEIKLLYETDSIFLQCTYSLNIVPEKVSCSNGHSYYTSFDREKECPYCMEYVDYIEVHPVGELTVLRGTGLAANGVTVRVVYMDGHEETLHSGFSDNLDENYIGRQLVTVSYKSKDTVVAVNNVVEEYICSECGTEGWHEEGQKLSLCKECFLAQPYFTGNVWHYETEYTEAEILEKVYEKSVYELKKHDFIKFEIMLDGNRKVIYGTEVRGGTD